MHALAALATLLGCRAVTLEGDGGDTAAPGPDPSEALFARDHVLEVAIEMDPDDWDALRSQRRNLMEMITGDCMDGPFESPYTYFEGDVVIDGRSFERAGVRKKGLVGSESSTKPSLKLKLDRYVDGRELYGFERITLNNARQDPSYLHQCLAYDVFRAAGVPAPRCSFAHVTVDGEDLGLYVNVESVRKAFLRLRFDDPDGRLYEGTLSDFRDGWLATFELKGDDDGDRSDLARVAAALEQPDDAVLDALAEVIDLDEYLAFWATEVLVGHWDGYAGNTNNFFVYGDPSTGRFSFVPWGVDATFERDHPFGEGEPNAVVAWAALPHRLLEIEEGRAAYAERLRALLDGAWDEAALLDEVDAFVDLVDPYVASDERDAFEEGVDAVRSFIEGRRAAILDELEAGGPEWSHDLREQACLVEIGRVSGTFETTWNTSLTDSWWTEGASDWALELWGAPWSVAPAGAAAGATDDGGLLLVTGTLHDSLWLVPYFLFPLEDVRDGAEFEVDWDEVEAYLLYSEDLQDWQVAAYLYDGTLSFDEGNPANGATLRGRFDVAVYGAEE